jgi:hypothetical protein
LLSTEDGESRHLPKLFVFAVCGFRGGAASYAKKFNTGNQLPPIWHEFPLAFFWVGVGR